MSAVANPRDPDRMAAELERFGDLVEDEAPTYSLICRELSTDPALGRILEVARAGQPLANVLLAAVHYLLLADPGHRLATHYPSVVGAEVDPVGDLVEEFRSFCESHQDELQELVATRTVQTNEVRRCAALLPAFADVARRTEQPLALIELGASAGLNLLFDKYQYRYGGGAAVGPEHIGLLIETELRSGRLPELELLPEVVWRRGIDLRPIDVRDADAVRWLRALLWPTQVERMERLDSAIAIAQQAPPGLIAADATQNLGQIVAGAPPTAALVVFHTFVMNQLSDEQRTSLHDQLTEFSRQREVHRIGIDMGSTVEHEIRYTRYGRRGSTEAVLGVTHHHGEWLAWTA